MTLKTTVFGVQSVFTSSMNGVIGGWTCFIISFVNDPCIHIICYMYATYLCKRRQQWFLLLIQRATVSRFQEAETSKDNNKDYTCRHDRS